MGNGRRVGKGRVRKVEEEAGYGKGSNESQCERGYRGEVDVCSENFIYYFSHWHYWNKQPYSVHFRRSTVFTDQNCAVEMASVLPCVQQMSTHFSFFSQAKTIEQTALLSTF